MSLEWRVQSKSLAWSNPVIRWWGLLTLVSGANIAVWFLLYRQLAEQPTDDLGNMSGIQLMLILCAFYVFGCAFRSFLPRADVQRICLFDTWLSSVIVGRTVATVAEICFAAQWVIDPAPAWHDGTGRRRFGRRVGDFCRSSSSRNACPWYAVLTTNYWGKRHREFALGGYFYHWNWSLPIVCRGSMARLVVLAITIVGIAGYPAFLMTFDVRRHLRRWGRRSPMAASRSVLCRSS